MSKAMMSHNYRKRYLSWIYKCRDIKQRLPQNNLKGWKNQKKIQVRFQDCSQKMLNWEIKYPSLMDSCSGKKGECRIVNYFQILKVRNVDNDNCFIGVAHVNIKEIKTGKQIAQGGFSVIL